MTRRPKALIIGGGIAGPVTGIFLKKAGIDAEVFEAWPYATGIGGGLQIAPNGMHVLAEIGLASEMIARGSVAESFDFYSQGGDRLGSVNRNMKARFGQPAVNMCRATLNEMLVNKAWCANVELRFEKRLVAIEDRADRPVVAHFADGTFAEGDFVIGADGVHSAVRGHVIPDGPKPFDTGLIGFGGFVPRAVIEHSPIGRRVVTTFGQSGFFGYGFCSSDPDDGVMWWSTQPSHGVDAATYRAMSQDQLRQHLAEIPRRLARSDPADHRCRREHRGDRHARCRDLADLVAQADAADRRRRPRHQPACRPGRVAGAGRRDAARTADADEAGIVADIPEFRGRAASARRKDRGAGPPQRQQQARVQPDRRLDPRPHDEIAAAGQRAGAMDWMYAYDPRAA